MKFKYMSVKEKTGFGTMTIQRVDIAHLSRSGIESYWEELHQKFPKEKYVVCQEESNQELPTFMAKIPETPKPDTHLVGGKILTMENLEAMNRAEVKARAWQYCTVETPDHGDFLATVAFSEESGAWEPKEVFYENKWISIDEFESSHEGGVCSFKYYRRFK